MIVAGRGPAVASKKFVAEFKPVLVPVGNARRFVCGKQRHRRSIAVADLDPAQKMVAFPVHPDGVGNVVQRLHQSIGIVFVKNGLDLQAYRVGVFHCCAAFSIILLISAASPHTPGES